MFKLKLFSIPLFLAVLFLNCLDRNPLQINSKNSQEIMNHEAWDVLLKKHVDDNGNVDYTKFAKDRDKLNEYLTYLAENPISDSAKKEERLAYYINLYNAGTVQLILENYPLKSIKDIFRPWGKDRIRISDEKYSLGDIEHKILRKMNEPRIHFAINCASISCPKLQNEAFLSDIIEEQLEKASFEFVNDQSKNTIGSEEVGLSKIFDWYKSDFTTKGTLVDYLNRYSKIKISENAEIDYINYDWRLNELE